MTLDIQILINPTMGLLNALSTASVSLSSAIVNNETLIEQGYDIGKHTNIWDRLVTDITTATTILDVTTRFLNKV